MHAVASATGTSGANGSAGEERGPDLRRQAILRSAAMAVDLHLRVPFPRGQAQDETVVALPIQPVVPAQQLVIAAPVGLPIFLAFAFHDVPRGYGCRGRGEPARPGPLGRAGLVPEEDRSGSASRTQPARAIGVRKHDHRHGCAPFVTPDARGMRARNGDHLVAEAKTAERDRRTFRLLRRLTRRRSSGRVRLRRLAAAEDRQRVGTHGAGAMRRAGPGVAARSAVRVRLAVGDHAFGGVVASGNE